MHSQVLRQVHEHVLGEEASKYTLVLPQRPPSVLPHWRQTEMTASQAHAAETLHARYSGPTRDLKRLLGLLLPDTNLTGIGGD